MSKKLFISLLIAIMISPLSLAQDDNTDVQEEATMEEEASVDDTAESAEEPVEGMIASAKYTCDLQGMTRRVEISYEVPGSSVPCSVNYYKDTEVPGEVNTLWTANNVEGYCEEKAAAFVDKLGSWGWSCQEN